MVMDKESALVDQLLDKTRRRSITWEPTAKNDELFRLLVGACHSRSVRGGTRRSSP